MINDITFDMNSFIINNNYSFKINSIISKSIPDNRQMVKIISKTRKRRKKDDKKQIVNEKNEIINDDFFDT